METIRIETRQENSRFSALLRIIAAGLLSACCMESASVLFLNGVEPIAPFAALATAFLLCAAEYDKRAGILPLAAAAFGVLIGLIWFRLWGGVLFVLDAVNTAFGNAAARVSLRHAGADADGVAAVMGLGATLLTLLANALLKTRAKQLLGVPLLALPVIAALLSETLPSALLLAGAICFVMALTLPETGEPQAGRAKTATVCIAVFLLLSGSLLPMLPKTAPKRIETWKSESVRTLRAFRFGSASGSGLPDGDFSLVGSLKRSQEPMLEITMSQPESLYLRGFVGSVYTGDGFLPAENRNLSEGSDLFYWLHKAGFFGETQVQAAARLADPAAFAAQEPITLRIRCLGASRAYVYAPYELVAADASLLEETMIGDQTLASPGLFGQAAYTLTASTNQVKRYPALARLLLRRETVADPALSSYLVCESHYNRYVYDQFLEVPADTAALLNELLGPTDAGNGAHADYGETRERILEFFDETVEYSETAAMRGGNDDFIEEFLTKTKSGCDVHYAAATVMLLRYFGIPARYVEGYLTTPEDREMMLPDVPYTLTGYRAHAWAEFYQDGIGFVPLETAPAYLERMEREDIAFRGRAIRKEQTSAAENDPGLEMQEDLYDEGEERTLGERLLPLLGAAAVVLAALLAALAVALLAYVLTHLLERRRSFRLNERDRAAANLYRRMYRLFQLRYPDVAALAPSDYLSAIEASDGAEAAMRFRRAITAAQKTLFGGEPIDEAAYQELYKTVMTEEKALVRCRIFALVGRWKRIWNRKA